MTISAPPDHAAALAAKGRAVTSEHKRAVIERILAAWEKKPALRLGQFIASAILNSDCGIFFAEDAWLAEACEKFAGEP